MCSSCSGGREVVVEGRGIRAKGNMVEVGLNFLERGWVGGWVCWGGLG